MKMSGIDQFLLLSFWALGSLFYRSEIPTLEAPKKEKKEISNPYPLETTRQRLSILIS